MTTPSHSKSLESMLRRYCAEAEGRLGAVCLHVIAGGGRTRANLLLQASERQDKVALQAACALEMMHAATLLQDDIFDRSVERRGRRAAYLEFGEAPSVLASDWLLLRSLELAAEIDPLYFQQLACAARRMAATVAKELHPPNLSGLSEARAYIEEICHGKTASLFAVALYGAALLHPERDRAHASRWAALGSCIGCTYQLLDDCLDVYAPEGALNKTTGVDLQQGRLTLPLLTALQIAQSAGQGVSFNRFREARLTAEQAELLGHALTDNVVRANLEDQVRRQMRLVSEGAEKAAIPYEAVNSAFKQMMAKVTLCFGRSEPSTGCTEHVQQVYA